MQVRRRRHGLSLLEVLVVIGVIGMLLAISLPAVVASREAARATECRSHLHQIGLAVENFHASHQKLMPNHRHLYDLMPHVDQGPLYEMFEANYRSIDSGHGPLTFPNPPQAGPRLYVCPTDPLARPEEWRISYYMNDGGDLSRGGGAIPKALGSKAFRDFSDGLSNSALFAERLIMEPPGGPDETARGRPLRFWWLSRRIFVPGEEAEFADYCLDPVTKQQASQGPRYHFDILYLQGGESVYNHRLPPNEWAFSNGDQPRDGSIPATSLHRGGAHVLMADGAVKFVPNTVDRKVWWAVGTIAAGDASGL